MKPLVRRNKTDLRESPAISVAAGRSDIRPVSSRVRQQALRALERSRELLVKERPQLRNSLRPMISEFGLAAAQGYRGFADLRARLASQSDGLPATLVTALSHLAAQFDALTPASEKLEDRIRQGKANPDMRRLSAIPVVGVTTAHAIVAAIEDGRLFAWGRGFAAGPA